MRKIYSSTMKVEEGRMEECVLKMPLGVCMDTFNLERAVCNHGLFMMAPNIWIPSTKTLQRPLRLANLDDSVFVSISHIPYQTFLRICVHGVRGISKDDEQAIFEQVARMLRISARDERDVKEFQELNLVAKEKKFGRLFRSPTLFEDCVKSLLFINSSWTRTLDMAENLCRLHLDLSRGVLPTVPYSRKTICSSKKTKGQQIAKADKEILSYCWDMYNFPNAKELANVDKNILRVHCKLSFRAEYVHQLAKKFDDGKLKLEGFKDLSRLQRVKGFGPFACANVSMCMGSYEHIPIDTETIRHLREMHGKTNCNKKTVEGYVKEIYDKDAPFQCLSYWLEMCNYYQDNFGKLSKMSRDDYRRVTGTLITRKRKSKDAEEETLATTTRVTSTHMIEFSQLNLSLSNYDVLFRLG